MATEHEIAIARKAIILASCNVNGTNEFPYEFALVNGKPLLYYAVRTFLEAYDDLQVVLVLPETYIGNGQEVIDGYFDASRIVICPAGSNRFESVQKGISRLNEEDCIVFVHDAVWCLVSDDLIHRCFTAATKNNTAIPALSIKGNVRRIEDDQSVVAKADDLRIVQSPQAFHSTILRTAFDIDYKPHFTDEAAVVEAYGLNVNLIEGEQCNIPVEDEHRLKFAQSVLS